MSGALAWKSGEYGIAVLSLIPFDAIKIDQDLLSQLRVTPLETLRLISTLVQIGQDMNRVVVVEGLEDASMIEAVTILGASSGQGYGLARPMSADSLVEWARGFSMPVRVDTASTLLGALAFHCKMGHHDVPLFDIALADCPVAWHLEQQCDPDTEQARCYAALHGGGVQREGQGFLPWLAQQVRNEGRDAR
ncbi:MAG TPA: EAL domain-containing protein [Rhodocyclaceae bacterium]|nr:EAL domain-containing protein [Rhodocyclaceae bacterium]